MSPTTRHLLYRLAFGGALLCSLATSQSNPMDMWSYSLLLTWDLDEHCHFEKGFYERHNSRRLGLLDQYFRPNPRRS